MSIISAGTAAGTALVSTGNTDGTLQLQVNGTTPSITLAANGSIGVGSSPSYGSANQVLQSNGSGAAPTWVTPSGGYTLGTPVVTTSGTYATFTGIPAGVKSVIINFFEVSSTNTLPLEVQFGTSSAFATSGYKSVGSTSNAGSGTFTFDDSQSAFQLTNAVQVSHFLNGSVTFTLLNSTNNYWTSQGILCTQGSQLLFLSAGSLDLVNPLTRLRITFGTADFDAGQINIAYL